MRNNSFGRLLTVTTFGESHGPAIGCVVDGCPSRIPLGERDIQPALDRRRPGGPLTSERPEPDRVEILSGVHDGQTTGHPVCLLIRNRNQDPSEYRELSDVLRPGHADGAYLEKYGLRDPNGGGRASARETAARVAAGAVAQKVLASFAETAGVRVVGGLTELGGVAIDPDRWQDEAAGMNPLFCPDPEAVPAMLDALERARRDGDSLGGVVEVRCHGVPAGLGEPVHDKLDARVAHALMGVNAVKGVEVGDGFAAARLRGSDNNDQMRSPASGRFAHAFLTNHAGGVLGGISTGQCLVARMAVKPTPSIRRRQQTVTAGLENADLSVEGRHDPAAAIRAVPVAEAMLWLVLADFFLLHRARSGGPRKGAT